MSGQAFQPHQPILQNARVIYITIEDCKQNQMSTKIQSQGQTHFDVKEDAETLKNVASDSEATALASIVFPLPGGPKRSNPEWMNEL